MALFRFRSASSSKASDPLSSPKSAAAWLESLPSVDAIARQQTVMRALADGVTVPGADLSLDRVAAVELVDAELAVDRDRLFAQYVEHVHSSPAAANRIWQAAYEISQGFIAAYRVLLDHALGRAQELRWKDAIPRLFARLIHFYGIDAKLRVVKSERWIPGKWQELHRLYRRAEDLGIARRPVHGAGAAAGPPRSTIEQEYIEVLLTQQLNTGTLAPADIDWALTEIRGWSEELELSREPQDGRGFCVDLDGKSGLFRSDEPVGAVLRYLDTSSLTARLDGALDELRGRTGHGSESERRRTSRRTSVLEKLRPMLCPEMPQSQPRGPRIKVSSLAQVRSGIVAIVRDLAASDGQGLGGEILAKPGRPAEPRVVPHAARPGPGERLWQIDNRSETGLRLIGPVGQEQGLALGALIAVRDSEDPDWTLGVVRRVTRLSTDRIEIGVSILSMRAHAVAAYVKRNARADLGITVDGIDVSTIGERFDAIYVPPPARPERPISARTLVIPANEFAEGREIMLATARTLYTIVLRGLLEPGPDWIWTGFEITAHADRN